MQVFITGATGYIGFAVSAALRRHGHRVRGLTRNGAKAGRLGATKSTPSSATWPTQRATPTSPPNAQS